MPVVTKENVLECIEIEIENIKPVLIKNKIYPMLILGRNFNSDAVSMTILCNPNLDTSSKRIAVLRDALEAEIEKSKRIN